MKQSVTRTDRGHRSGVSEEALLWQVLVENTQDYVLIVNREGQVRFLNHINPGYTSEQVLNSTIFDYQPESVHEVVRDALARAFDHGETVVYETTGEGTPGVPAVYECRLIPLAERGLSDAAMLIATDVTARRKAEADNAGHFALLDAVASGVRELIFVKDRNSRFLFVNSAITAVHNCAPDEIIGGLDSDLFPPETAARMVAEDQAVMDSGQARTIEETLPLASGLRTCLTTRTPWRDLSGEIVGVLGISQDITELKAAECRLNHSEHFLKTIADASPLIIYVFDIETGRNVYANRQIAQDLGYTPEQIQDMGSGFLPMLLHPDDLARVPELLSRWESATDDEIFEQEYRMLHADGSWRWFLGRDTVFKRGDDGAVQQIIGTAQDITERIEIQNSLRQSEQRLRAIVDLDPHCVKLVSKSGKVLSMNRAGLQMVEADSEVRVLNRPVFELVAPEFRDDFINLHERVCAGESGSIEFEIVGLKGTRKRLVSDAVPIQFGPNDEIAHLAVTRDVTAERDTEQLIAQQQMHLARFSRLSIMGQMAAAITHEITQPLASIANYANACQLLLEATPHPESRMQELMAALAAQSNRASGILKQIRSFITDTSSPRRRLDLADVIGESVQLVRPELRFRRVRLQFEEPSGELPAEIDRVQIQQVLVNLVTNACDAMSETPLAERQIVISCRQVDDMIITEVCDTGPGLSPEIGEHLFDPFVTSKRKGMGLGLAICRDIVKSHDGEIEAANRPEGGAVFRFRLPVAKP